MQSQAAEGGENCENDGNDEIVGNGESYVNDPNARERSLLEQSLSEFVERSASKSISRGNSRGNFGGRRGKPRKALKNDSRNIFARESVGGSVGYSTRDFADNSTIQSVSAV